MRRGYWKTLLRRLRDRVAEGCDTLEVADTCFVIAQISASDDDSVETPNEMSLAVDVKGRQLVLDPINSLVSIRYSSAPEGDALLYATGMDYPAMIAALKSSQVSDDVLGARIEELILMPGKSRRKGIFDE